MKDMMTCTCKYSTTPWVQVGVSWISHREEWSIEFVFSPPLFLLLYLALWYMKSMLTSFFFFCLQFIMYWTPIGYQKYASTFQIHHCYLLCFEIWVRSPTKWVRWSCFCILQASHFTVDIKVTWKEVASGLFLPIFSWSVKGVLNFYFRNHSCYIPTFLHRKKAKNEISTIFKYSYLSEDMFGFAYLFYQRNLWTKSASLCFIQTRSTEELYGCRPP